MRTTIPVGVILVATLAVPVTIHGRDTRKELIVDLKFVPQEGVKSNSPDLAPALLERTTTVRVEDGRGAEAASNIGQGTNDDDQTFPIRASTEVASYLSTTTAKVFGEWGIKTAEPAERVLTVRLTRFSIDESNKALGSVYAAEVKLTLILTDRSGTTLAQVASSGSAHRYGRARSADNCNEVLSDSLKEALANAVSDPRLQEAWASGRKSVENAAEPRESVEERLRKLDELLKKGLITKDEYDKKRAEILKEL